MIKCSGYLLLFLVIAFLPKNLISQSGVQISPMPVPLEPGAILQVQSHGQGVLLPKTRKDSVLHPVHGLILFDTTTNNFMFYDSNQWVVLLKSTAFDYYFRDQDGDMFGNNSLPIFTFDPLPGYVIQGTDCNDNNPSINPGEVELCDNLDNDCDGQIDEGFDVDMDGYTTCEGDCEDNNFDVNPGITEMCDYLDNNCDGNIDEGLNVGGTCVVGNGACETIGVIVCDGNGGVTCTGSPGPPSTEICNGIDDDCDGDTDEGFNLGDSCTVGVGACQVFGVFICDGNGGVMCSASPGLPSAESCNGIDDDCDGDTDEGFNLGAPCMVGVGACQSSGVFICDGNGGVTCSASPGIPATEICGDGIDNDCDGLTDENCVPINYAVLQFPPSITMSPGNTPFIYGQVFSSGVTNPPGQGAGIMAEVGYGADGSDPSAGGWTWVTATYNTDYGNNDEYQGLLTVNTIGTYDYAYRFSGDGGSTWVYCDLDGTPGYDPLQAGNLVVQP